MLVLWEGVVTPAVELSPAGPRKKRGRPRGKTQRSLDLIQAAYSFLAVAFPATVRGVCYQLFVAGLIASMKKNDTDRVSRLLTHAREQGMIPWEWIVDEHREIEEVSSWRNPDAYVQAVRRSYRRDFWAEQPRRVQVWSEKGTVRGVLRPVLDEYGVGFLPVHGFNSATKVHETAEDWDGRDLLVLYVGDWDPSGMCMSEKDLPARIERYGGEHVTIERIALLPEDLSGLPYFDAKTKSKDSRYKWFVEHYGTRCWELDAMHPNDLRARVQDRILAEIEPEAWARCERAQEAEQKSLEALLDKWRAA